MQHPKFVNSRLGFIESVHEREQQMRYLSRRLLCMRGLLEAGFLRITML